MSEGIRTRGQRPDLGSVGYISLTDLNPWQMERLLEVVIGVFSKELQGHTIHAARINRQDIELVTRVMKREKMHYIRKRGVRDETKTEGT
jgi:hypothetical protein